MPVRLEDRWLLIEAAAVLHVLGRQKWLPIPQSSASLPGVCAWRGRAIPVVDLFHMLQLGRTKNDSLDRTLILTSALGILAVPVSEARAVTMLGDEELRTTHATSLPHTSAEVEMEKAAVAVLDVASLVQSLGGRSLNLGSKDESRTTQ